MAGVIILIAVMLVLGPFALFVGGALWSALLGTVLEADRRNAEADAPAET